MPLATLVIMVVLGLALAIGAVHFSGLSRPFRLSDRSEALAAFGADHPGERPLEVFLASAGTQAWLALDSGGIGLVAGFGSRWLTRILTPESIISLRREGVTLEMRIADFTLPRLTTQLCDEGSARRLAALLEGRRTEAVENA